MKCNVSKRKSVSQMNCTLSLYSKQHFALCSRRDERRAVKKMEQVRSTPINFVISLSNLTYFLSSYFFFQAEKKKSCKEGKKVLIYFITIYNLWNLYDMVSQSSIAYVYPMDFFFHSTSNSFSPEYIDN